MKLSDNLLTQPSANLARVFTMRMFQAGLILTSVAAQSSAEVDLPDVQELEAFVVTGEFLYADEIRALKSPTPIIDVPQSLSITTADQITQQGFDSISDIVYYTPGLSSSQGEGHRDAVVIRGVRSTADFFVDGVRDDVQYYRSFYNIEQVEILRGPNALLFGRGGTGGVLNRVLKKAYVGENFTGYQVSVDTFGAYSAQFDSNLAINAHSGARVNAFYEELANHREPYAGERFGLNPTFKYELGEDTTLDLSYEYNDFERVIDRGIPTGADGRPVTALTDIFFGDHTHNLATLEANVFRTKLQHTFSDTLKARLNVGYGHYDKFYQNFYSTAYDEATGIVELDGYVDGTQRQTLNVSGDVVAVFETGQLAHTVVTGFEFISTANDNYRYNSFFDQTGSDRESFRLAALPDFRDGVGINASGAVTTNDFTVAFGDDTAADLEVFSFFVQDQLGLSDHWDLLLGVRFDRFDFAATEFDQRGDPVADRRRTDEEVTPRLGLLHKPAEDISVYASYSESFLPRSGEQFANISDKTQRLAPDTFTNFEAGAKWDLSSQVSLTTALFRLDQSSLDVVSGSAGELERIDSEITGFEAQFQGQVTAHWFTTVGYSYLDGENGATGLRPRELPRHMFSIWNRYQVAEKLGLGLGLVYQDDSFADNANRATLPSFTRLDAAAYYDLSDTISLQVTIENLTDTRYFPHAHNVHEVTVGAPISARLAIIGRF